MRLYEKARYLIRNNIFQTISSLSAAVLCNLAELGLGTVGALSLGTICHEIAKKVINYIEQRGFTQSPRVVCSDIGVCTPPQKKSPWGWKST